MKNVSEGERRREGRTIVSGRVEIVLDIGLPLTVEGELIDLSSHGFRAAHNHHTFEPGDQVSFHHDSASGQAKVMWNRVTSGRVETGFLVA